MKRRADEDPEGIDQFRANYSVNIPMGLGLRSFPALPANSTEKPLSQWNARVIARELGHLVDFAEKGWMNNRSEDVESAVQRISAMKKSVDCRDDLKATTKKTVTSAFRQINTWKNNPKKGTPGK
jgi:hypothetical protein